MDSRELSRLSRHLQLLSVNNTKTLKSSATHLIGILHLAPAWESGFNTCPMHTKECAATCIYFAGKGSLPVVKAARIRRTQFYYKDRNAFLLALHGDIWLVKETAARFNLTPAIRLNGTSDIKWERHEVPQSWPDVQFYDYTKLLHRMPLPNYHLTYSFSGVNLTECKRALEQGMNVAVPFLKLPATWQGYPVVDGDNDDLRFLTPGPVVIGLKAKGRLRSRHASQFLGDNHA